MVLHNILTFNVDTAAAVKLKVTIQSREWNIVCWCWFKTVAIVRYLKGIVKKLFIQRLFQFIPKTRYIEYTLFGEEGKRK